MQIKNLNLAVINLEVRVPGSSERGLLQQESGSPGWPCSRQEQRPYQPEAHPRGNKQEKQCTAPAKVQDQSIQTGEKCLQIDTGNSRIRDMHAYSP